MSRLTSALLKGLPTKAKLFSRNPKQRPHYHILVETEGQQFDIAVNIASEAHTNDLRVLYAIKQNITPPQMDALLSLPNGIFDLPDRGIVGIDYVHDGLVTRDEMQPLPLFDPSEPIESQGEEKVKQLVDRVVADPNAVLYAFGHRYDQLDSQNAAWGFQPDDGIHNIHMNQGNYRGNHDDENGRGEDGALFLYFPDTKTWQAVYVAFQTQSFDNDANGYPKDDTKQPASSGGHHGSHRHHHKGGNTENQG
jgi:uncharacterized protein YukJ